MFADSLEFTKANDAVPHEERLVHREELQELGLLPVIHEWSTC